jgi:hypothetical protein
MKILDILFSDQTDLGFMPENNLEYRTLYELLISPNEIKYKYFQEYDQPKITYLIDKGCLIKNDQNIIEFNNKSIILVLEDLYNN